MDVGYLQGNQAASARVAQLVEQLSEADLQVSLGEGWTVKAALAHLAFWDRFAAGLIDGWSAGGFQPVAASADPVNAAALADWLALPSEHVRREIIAAAEAANRAVEAVTPELAAAIEAGGRGRMLDRSRHRNEHVAQITATIGK